VRDIQLFLISTQIIQFKCYISVFSTFLYELYNKNNYPVLKKFHPYLSVLRVYTNIN